MITSSGAKQVYNFDYYLNFIQAESKNNKWDRVADLQSVDVFQSNKLNGDNYLQTSRGTLLSNRETFTIKKPSDFLSESSNEFEISRISLRLNDKVSDLIKVSNIGVKIKRNNSTPVFVDYLASAKNGLLYEAKDVNERIDTQEPIENLFRFTVETAQEGSFSQLNVDTNLSDTIFFTLEISGQHVRNADTSINKNVLESENVSNINVYEYSRQVNIYEKDQGIYILDPDQITTISIDSVDISTVQVPALGQSGETLSRNYLVRTYKLGKGVLYHANIKGDITLPAINIPEIKVTDGKFITYKYLSTTSYQQVGDQTVLDSDVPTEHRTETLFLFYLTVDAKDVDRLPNKFSKTIYIYRNDFGFDINSIQWTTSNPL